MTNGEECGIIKIRYCDEWENPISTDESSDSEVGEINPFRYKSYYYDSETRLYYLRSRSYDPVVGRFLNADSTDYLGVTQTLLSYNLFAYCENNPVNSIDETGFFGTPIQWVMATIGGIVGWFLGDYIAHQFGYHWGWKYWAVRTGITIGSSVLGGFAGSALTAVVRRFLMANPQWIAKIPAGILSFLGLQEMIQQVGFRNGALLVEHFNKHASEWGNRLLNPQQYLKAANDLLHRAGYKIFQVTSPQGWLFKYVALRNEFILLNPDGTISTFYKPVEGIAYWYEQVRKYGG